MSPRAGGEERVSVFGRVQGLRHARVAVRSIDPSKSDQLEPSQGKDRCKQLRATLAEMFRLYQNKALRADTISMRDAKKAKQDLIRDSLPVGVHTCPQKLASKNGEYLMNFNCNGVITVTQKNGIEIWTSEYPGFDEVGNCRPPAYVPIQMHTRADTRTRARALARDLCNTHAQDCAKDQAGRYGHILQWRIDCKLGGADVP